MKKRTFILAALLSVSVSVFAQEASRPDLHLVIGLTGENGIVALQDGTVSMFSDKNIGIVSANDRKIKFVDNTTGVVSLGFNDSHWEQAKTHLNLAAASEPGMCDRLNQINLASVNKAISTALPKGARIKAVKKWDKFVYVIYSISNIPIKYDIQIALMKLTKEGRFTVINSDTVTKFGAFCGVRDAGSNNLFLLVDQPTGSSDYLAVYVYAIAK